MRIINKIIFSIISSVMLLSAAAAERVTYCPGDANNPAIYTFKKGSSLPEGWVPGASWDFGDKNPKTINNTNPADIINNLTEGQYSFLNATLYPSKLICTYALFADKKQGILAILGFTKEGVLPQSIEISSPGVEISPEGGYRGWFNPSNRFYEPGTQLPPMCGSSVNPGTKVTDCPFKQ
jgi:hypothetical protein